MKYTVVLVAVFISTSICMYCHESMKRGKMFILTTDDFARLFGSGIDSTILGAIDRLCSLTIERSLSTLLWIH